MMRKNIYAEIYNIKHGSLAGLWALTQGHVLPVDVCRHALDGKRVILYYLLNPLQSIYVENCFISLHISQSTSSSLSLSLSLPLSSVCVCVSSCSQKEKKCKYVGIIVEEKTFLVASHSLGQIHEGTPKVVPNTHPPPPRHQPQLASSEAKRLCAAIYVIFS